MRAEPAQTVVWAVFFGVPALQPVAVGMALQGASLALIGDGPSVAAPGLLQLSTPAADRAGLADAFALARAQIGPPDLVVMACGAPEALLPAPLATLTEEAWRAQAQSPQSQALRVLQTVLPSLPEGGRIVALGPAIAMIGAQGLSPLVSAFEGQRGLLKAAARQWGPRGIRLNWLSLAAEIFAPELGQVNLPLGPELGSPPPPLPRPDLQHDTAALLLLLAAPGAAALTGATINLDGGEWMLP